MSESTNAEQGDRNEKDHLVRRLGERLVPACIVLLSLIEITGKYEDSTAPAAWSLRRYLATMAIAVILGVLLAIGQRSRLRQVGPRLISALVILAVGFSLLLSGWSFWWFVAASAVLVVPVELNLWVSEVGQCVKRSQAASDMMLVSELVIGVLVAYRSILEADLGSGYQRAVVWIGFITILVLAWVMVYRQGLREIIQGVIKRNRARN
jgi:hypothetical protein